MLRFIPAHVVKSAEDIEKAHKRGIASLVIEPELAEQGVKTVRTASLSAGFSNHLELAIWPVPGTEDGVKGALPGHHPWMVRVELRLGLMKVRPVADDRTTPISEAQAEEYARQQALGLLGRLVSDAGAMISKLAEE